MRLMRAFASLAVVASVGLARHVLNSRKVSFRVQLQVGCGLAGVAAGVRLDSELAELTCLDVSTCSGGGSSWKVHSQLRTRHQGPRPWSRWRRSKERKRRRTATWQQQHQYQQDHHYAQQHLQHHIQQLWHWQQQLPWDQQ